MDRVALVMTGFDAWNRGDWEAFWALFDESAELDLDPHWPEPGVRRGIGTLRAFFESMLEAFAQAELAVQSVEEVGDLVLARFEFAGSGRSTHLAGSFAMSGVYAVDAGGKVRSVVLRFDHEAAREIAAARASAP